MESEFIRRRRQRLLENFRKACEHRSIPMQLVDLLVHKVRINTYWEDYYRYGFYKQDITWDEKILYVSDNTSYYWPWETNSVKFDRLFVRKTLHKPILESAGLPISRILFKAGLAYSINTKEKFAAELAKIDQPFVTKFDGGGGGKLNMSFVPENGKYRFANELLDGQEIWHRYKKVLSTGILVEERIENHPVLADIHPESLNTLRLNMIKTVDGQWQQMRPLLKIGRGGSHIDNVSSGGLMIALDKNGIMLGGVDEPGNRFDVHPDTNVDIRGKSVPFFEESLELARRASETFGFMGTIGWDVGITADGPKIIEGNAWWGARYDQEVLGPLLTPEIAAGLVPRHWWTPWIRTHMNPDYKRRENGGWWTRFLSARRGRRAAKILARLKSSPDWLRRARKLPQE